jgi:very-short-patch-repair endonuclease
METRLRLLILDEGLPRPETQAVICDVAGIFAARIDLYYPDARLGIEYDGGVHRDKLVEDNRRQNKLMNAGIQLLRYTADDVYNHRDRIAGEIRALRKARLPASRS